MSTSLHLFLEGVRNLHHPGGLTISEKPSNLPIENTLALRLMLIMFNILRMHIGILLNLKSDQPRFLMMKNLQSSRKPFYSYVKSKQKIKPCIGPLEKADGFLTINDHNVAETINTFYM